MLTNGNDVLPKCAICGEAGKDMARDHCHATGLSRDRLCRPCNLGLGHFRDSPARLRAAAAYIEAHAAAVPDALLALTRSHAEDRLTAALRMMEQQASAAKAKTRDRLRNQLPVAPRLTVDARSKRYNRP